MSYDFCHLSWHCDIIKCALILKIVLVYKQQLLFCLIDYCLLHSYINIHYISVLVIGISALIHINKDYFYKIFM